MWPFPLFVPGVGGGRYASIMDPTYVPILSALVGGGVVAIVDQFALHRRTQTDRGEAARAIQREAAGGLLTAADLFTWELIRSHLAGAVPGVPTDPDSQVVALTEGITRLDAEIRRARVVITEPEARAIVLRLHSALEKMHDGLRSGTGLDGTEWAVQVGEALDTHTVQLQAVSERNLKPGGPDRRPRLPWRRKSGHAAGGE